MLVLEFIFKILFIIKSLHTHLLSQAFKIDFENSSNTSVQKYKVSFNKKIDT